MVLKLQAALLLAAALGGLASANLVCPIEEEVGDVDAVVVAFADLHLGPNCDRLQLPALQKIAAAKQMAEKVSQNVPITIGVHVMDTCGNKKTAVRMAFKSMVYSDKSICKNSPLLLGYLGPDDPATYDAVYAVTGVYKYIHVNPVAMMDSNNPYFISKVEQTQIVKALTNTLRHLHWSHFTLLHSEDVESTLLASTLSSTPGLCVPSVRQLHTPLTSSLSNALSRVPTRGVLVVGTPDHLIEVLKANAQLDSPHVLLLVTLESGLLPPVALMDSLSEAAVVLQLAPDRPIDKLQYQLEKSKLWDEYLHQQRCNFSTCSNTSPEVPELAATVQDVTSTAASEAVAAFARALRGAHRAKCGSMEGSCHELETTLPDEWRSRVGAQLGAQTQMLSHFDTFIKKAYSTGIQRVTNFTGINFPESRSDECHHEAGSLDIPKVTKRTTTTPAPHIFRDDVDFNVPEEETDVVSNVKTTKIPPKVKVIIPHEDDDDEDDESRRPSGPGGWGLFDFDQVTSLEFYMIMFGFACIVGILLCSLIYCVSSIFNVKKDESSENPHHRNNRNKNRNNNKRTDRNRGARGGSVHSGASSLESV